MLPIAYIRQNSERILASLAKRNFQQAPEFIERLLQLDEEHRKAKTEFENTQAQVNQASKLIGQYFKSGQKDLAETAKENAGTLSELAKNLKERVSELEQQIDAELLQMPNLLNESVPSGKSADDNEVYQAWPQALPPVTGLTHWDLAKKYNLIDFELGAKITGAGFPVYRGGAAKLQRALIAFFLDRAEKAGYLEYQVPHLVNQDSVRGTGQYPDKDAQMYVAERDALFLIPTAEVPLTNLYRDVILDQSELPIKLCGYTPCFRREAGSYGAHVRGLNRLHQFDKVEIVRIETPETSSQALLEMLEHVKGLLQDLELPYRILRLCGGDTGFASSLTFDFETYSAAQDRWLEVSSVSNFEIFQSTRLKLRYKRNDGSKGTETAHTLNGSALALPRIVATLLENHQTEDGVRIPKALQPYFGAEYLK